MMTPPRGRSYGRFAAHTWKREDPTRLVHRKSLLQPPCSSAPIVIVFGRSLLTSERRSTSNRAVKGTCGFAVVRIRNSPTASNRTKKQEIGFHRESWSYWRVYLSSDHSILRSALQKITCNLESLNFCPYSLNSHQPSSALRRKPGIRATGSTRQTPLASNL